MVYLQTGVTAKLPSGSEWKSAVCILVHVSMTQQKSTHNRRPISILNKFFQDHLNASEIWLSQFQFVEIKLFDSVPDRQLCTQHRANLSLPDPTNRRPSPGIAAN